MSSGATAIQPLSVAAEDYAERLAQHPDYRVLRRFVPRDRYATGTGALLGLFVDIEATGLDTESDEIIELAIVPFRFDGTNVAICEVLPPLVWLEEPKTKRISPEIAELTGITPEVVAGHAIDDDVANATIQQASLVIAHNADYDRRMGERRLPSFAGRAWACSQREIPWKKFGVNGGALANVLMSATGEFTDDAHRAAVDCQVGIHCLAGAVADGRSAFEYLIESVKQPTSRICAIDTPMSTKEMLRARGYRALYINGRFAFWYRDLKDDGQNVAAECQWVEHECYGFPQVKRISARDRFSVRADQ